MNLELNNEGSKTPERNNLRSKILEILEKKNPLILNGGNVSSEKLQKFLKKHAEKKGTQITSITINGKTLKLGDYIFCNSSKRNKEITQIKILHINGQVSL
jgi:hypothetical protein